jgi:hypothetical protein
MAFGGLERPASIGPEKSVRSRPSKAGARISVATERHGLYALLVPAGVPVMRRLSTTTVALFLTSQAAYAADISVVMDETADHPALILIKGKIGDNQGKDARALEARQFEALAGIQKKAAIVFLDSAGGRTMTAIQIGLLIQKRGFSTAVTDDAQCASACALIWIAGKERFMGTKVASVGFHAAWMPYDKFEAASGANAIIGAYLYQIGITDFATITQLASAPPQAMRWLSFYGDALTNKLTAKELLLSEARWEWVRLALGSKSQKSRIDTPGERLEALPPVLLSPPTPIIANKSGQP